MTSAQRAAETILRQAVETSALPLRIEHSGPYSSIVYGAGDGTLALDFDTEALLDNARPLETVSAAVARLEAAAQ